MKKTMLALMATVGLAFGAKAVNLTGFESYTGDFAYDLNDSGDALAPRYWVVTNATPDLSGTVLTTYGESAKPDNVPWAFTNTVNDTYLKVDTSNEVLYRSVEAVNDVNALNAGTAIGDGLYFDANVQFTASDGEPTYDSADKLVVWLKATEGENPTTNLVVTAAASADEYGVPQGITDFVVSNVAVDADTWYRLTVKAAVDASDHTYFNIYVDNNQVVATDRTNFYSMVNSNTTEGQKITAVGFQGTGAIDNLVWTTDDPFPEVVPTTVALTVAVTGETDYLEELTYKVNAGTPETYAEATDVVANEGDTITLDFFVYDGFSASIGGETLKPSGEVSDERYPYTFTVTVDATMIAEGLALTINVTENGSGDEPAQVVPGTPAEVEAESAEAAVAKAEKVIPEAVKTAVGAGGETYLSYFELVATGTETPGTYNVEMKLTTEAKASLEEDADDGVEDLLDAVNALTGEETKASANVTVPAGFYWALSSGTTLEGMANDAGNTPSAGTVNLSVTKETDDTAGFYQLLISPTPIPSTKE